MQADGYASSVTRACEAADITPRAYYLWFDDCEGFTAWWKSEAEKYFARQIGRVHAQALRCALDDSVKGNPAWAKLLMERFDQEYTPRQRTDTRVAVTARLDLTDLTEDELRRLAETTEAPLPEAPAGGAEAAP